MNSTPECVTKTPEIEAREKLAAIFSDAEQRGDNSKVSPELGKAAFDVNNLKANIPNNEAVDFCNQALGGYGKSLDYINNSPLETVQAIGNSLQLFREDKTRESNK